MEISSSALLEEGSTSSSTSCAYQESSRNAKLSGKWSAPIAQPPGRIGFRTMATVSFLMLAGSILLLSGLVFFFSAQSGSNDNKGLGMLVVAGILLLPGGYGLVNWYGSARGWHGYSYSNFNID